MGFRPWWLKVSLLMSNKRLGLFLAFFLAAYFVLGVSLARDHLLWLIAH